MKSSGAKVFVLSVWCGLPRHSTSAQTIWLNATWHKSDAGYVKSVRASFCPWLEVTIMTE